MLERVALDAAAVEKRRMHGISFVGKQVGCLPTNTVYARLVEKMSTHGDSAMEIIKYFNPLGSGYLRKPKVYTIEAKRPWHSRMLKEQHLPYQKTTACSWLQDTRKVF